jgi:hypothetical protein
LLAIGAHAVHGGESRPRPAHVLPCPVGFFRPLEKARHRQSDLFTDLRGPQVDSQVTIHLFQGGDPAIRILGLARWPAGWTWFKAAQTALQKKRLEVVKTPISNAQCKTGLGHAPFSSQSLQDHLQAELGQCRSLQAFRSVGPVGPASACHRSNLQKKVQTNCRESQPLASPASFAACELIAQLGKSQHP